MWTNDKSPYIVVETLLRPLKKGQTIIPSSGPPTPKALRITRSVLNRLSRSIHNESERQRQDREFLQQVHRVLPQLSTDQLDEISGEVDEVIKGLALTKEKRESFENLRADLKQALDGAYTHFARREVLRFCNSHRYRLNPLSVANAMAGLPFIGWRQSAKRCRKWMSGTDEGLSYRIFKVIRTIVNSCEMLPELSEYSKSWLLTQRSRSIPILELRKKQYFLRRSISAALKLEPSRTREELPYKITAEYLRSSQNPTAVDLVFAKREQI